MWGGAFRLCSIIFALNFSRLHLRYIYTKYLFDTFVILHHSTFQVWWRKTSLWSFPVIANLWVYSVDQLAVLLAAKKCLSRELLKVCSTTLFKFIKLNENIFFGPSFFAILFFVTASNDNRIYGCGIPLSFTCNL